MATAALRVSTRIQSRLYLPGDLYRAVFFGPIFLHRTDMLGLALSVSQIGMVACTMMFCLASRDFDLSVGSIVAFTGVLGATVINFTDNLWAGVTAALLSGAIIGCFNGIIIAYLRINALITTLATMEMVRGLAFIASHGQAVG